jgi:hypothetical protein
MDWKQIDSIRGYDGPAFRSGQHVVATKWGGQYLYWDLLDDHGRSKKSGMHLVGQEKTLTEFQMQSMFQTIDAMLQR